MENASPVHSMLSCKWNASCLQIKYLFILCKKCFSRKWNASCLQKCFSCTLWTLLQNAKNASAIHSMHAFLQIKCLLLAKMLFLCTLYTIAKCKKCLCHALYACIIANEMPFACKNAFPAHSLHYCKYNTFSYFAKNASLASEMPLACKNTFPMHSIHYCKLQKMPLPCTLCMYSCK